MTPVVSRAWEAVPPILAFLPVHLKWGEAPRGFVDLHDPLTFAGSAVFVVLVALAAAALPARRATHVE